MKTKYQNLLKSITILIAACMITSCSPVIYNARSSFSPGFISSPEQIEASIVSASRFFDQWTVNKVRPGEMQGILSYGQHRATVSIIYNIDHIEINYSDSSNFDYDPHSRTIHGNYNVWVKRFEKQIQKEIQYHSHLSILQPKDNRDIPKHAPSKEIFDGPIGSMEEQSKQLKDPAVDPFDLKGDQLGMNLDDFKRKYYRSVSGRNQDAPFCSDSWPNQKMNDLDAEAWNYQAGIIHCRINFPFEELEVNGGDKSTVAGFPVDRLLYRFVDRKLYAIDILFKHVGFLKVKRALGAKYGKTSSVKVEEYQNRLSAKFSGEILVWKNETSSIKLTERNEDLNTTSLTYEHKKLSTVAIARYPKPRVDDL